MLHWLRLDLTMIYCLYAWRCPFLANRNPCSKNRIYEGVKATYNNNVYASRYYLSSFLFLLKTLRGRVTLSSASETTSAVSVCLSFSSSGLVTEILDPSASSSLAGKLLHPMSCDRGASRRSFHLKCWTSFFWIGWPPGLVGRQRREHNSSR